MQIWVQIRVIWMKCSSSSIPRGALVHPRRCWESILHSDIRARDTYSETVSSLWGTSAPLNDSKRTLFSITWHSFPWKLNIQLSKGFQLLLAQGLCFYNSLWFMSIHHVSCSNVLGSWLIPLNIERTSRADITNRA